MNVPTGERIAKLEQHMVGQDDKLKEIANDIKEIKIVMQAQANLHEEIANLKVEIKEIKANQGFWRWFAPTLTGFAVAIVTPILTLLILNYLDKLK